MTGESLQPEIWKSSATEIAAAVRARRMSCREVVEAHLDRIETVNKSVNAVTVVLADDALARADAQDDALARGDAIGPLHGVPMTVKENIDLRGSATTNGARALADAVPEVDAPHVAQLLHAGAIPIGRTNLPDFGLRWHTDNDLRGATRNPWDASRTPGGSSGGDAVALATGMTPLGMGNDYGGSLRVPAQFCGICSLRPTLGRVPDHDSLAATDGTVTSQLFAVQGPMARRVADLRLALASMSERDANDPWWTPAPLASEPPALPIRVAVVREPGGEGVESGVADGIERAAHALADAGYEVVDIDPPALVEAAALWQRLVFAEIRTVMLPALRPLLSADALTFLELALASTPEIDLPMYMTALAERRGIARRWTLFQHRYPLVLGPICTRAAFECSLDVSGANGNAQVIDMMRFVTPLNLLGLPVVAVPVGVADGLPQAVQIIGDRYQEDLCLTAGEAIEARLGTLTPIDPVVDRD